MPPHAHEVIARDARHAAGPPPARGPTPIRARSALSIADVASRYGLELHRAGRVWMALCPFHDDHEPSLLLDPSDNHFHCFSAACMTRHGSMVDLVRHLEGVDHAEAVARLTRLAVGSPSQRIAAQAPTALPGPTRRRRPRRPAGQQPASSAEAGPEARACLTAAAELYANCLLGDAKARGYVERRGLLPDTLERCGVGYARGGELAPYLRWRGLSVDAATRAGLLRADGAETLAGRIVVPEFRGGVCLWMVGRALAETAAAAPRTPKYFGLAGDKPLLGWEWATTTSWPLRSVPAGVVIVEGPFDLLTLIQWGIPAVALVGTHVRTEPLRELHGFGRVYALLDDDEAGRAAAAKLCRALAPRALVVLLGDDHGAKDASDLAPRLDGQRVLLRALECAWHRGPGVAGGTTRRDRASGTTNRDAAA